MAYSLFRNFSQQKPRDAGWTHCWCMFCCLLGTVNTQSGSSDFILCGAGVGWGGWMTCKCGYHEMVYWLHMRGGWLKFIEKEWHTMAGVALNCSSTPLRRSAYTNCTFQSIVSQSCSSINTLACTIPDDDHWVRMDSCAVDSLLCARGWVGDLVRASCHAEIRLCFGSDNVQLVGSLSTDAGYRQ